MTEQSIGALAAGVVNKLAEQTGRAKPFPEQESVMPETVIDHYAKWAALLRGEKVMIHEPEPLCGFWRTRRSKTDKELIGVATWPGENGEIVALLGKSIVPMERVWPFYAKNPVTEAAYRAWEESGVWPDDHQIVKHSAQVNESVNPIIAGTNEPDDPVAMLRDQIESAKAGVSDYAKIQSDEQESQAKSLWSRLLELSREADKKRETEKRPHFEAAKAVDTLWMPLVKDAKNAADYLNKSMSAYETAKARAAAEAQRKADEERRRREEEARLAEEEGKPAPAPVLDLEPAPTPPPTTQVRGAYGRAAAVRVKHVVTGITDFTAVVHHYRHSLEPHLIAMAQKEIDAGFTVPGVSVEETRKVA